MYRLVLALLAALYTAALSTAAPSTAFAAQPSVAPAEDPLLGALQTELQRTMDGWQGGEDAPYLLSYRVVDQRSWELQALDGALSRDRHGHDRTLDVQARVGSAERDSSHRLRDSGFFDHNMHTSLDLPIEDAPLALRTALWQATDKAVQDAQEAWFRVQAEQRVKVADVDDSPDLSQEEPVVDLRPRVALEPDLSGWAPLLEELSERLQDDPDIYEAEASLRIVLEDRYVLSSEGTRLRTPRTWARVALWASTRADDGMNLDLYRWRDVAEVDQLPPADTLRQWAEDLRTDLVALRAAPDGEPYSGPVLLRGKAAGVFVHEVLGHRVEGHRQKNEDEGQTFKDKVGEQLLPETISIFDDPSLATWEGFRLNGHYAYDEEGVPAQRAVLVDHGVFRGFLMSRSPIEGFDHSNGHGRAQSGRTPVARMANTIVQAHDPLTQAQLRRAFVAELKAQGREWGLAVDDIGGGFTLTGRVFPNAFNVRAETAWRVYADGRPDELVRGIDLVGTPLVALSNVVAAGDDPDVFNGFCGAESGSVPNSAVSPTLLIRSLEVQKKETGSDRPPLLPKPAAGGDS